MAKQTSNVSNGSINYAKHDIMPSTIMTPGSFASALYKCNATFHKGFKSKTADFRMAKWDTTFQPTVTKPANIVNDLIIKAHDRFGNIITAIDTLLPQECQVVSEDSIWLYDLNPEMGPKNSESLRKLEALLNALVEEFCLEDQQTGNLNRYKLVALCYLHWAMVTPGVYHISGRVTRRRGKSFRHCAPVFAAKKPTQNKKASTEVKYKGPSHSKVGVIPKMQTKVDDIIEKMDTIIRKEDVSFDKMQIKDEFAFAGYVNEYLMTSGKFYVGANGAKKLNKLYQELQKARIQLQKAIVTAHSDVQSQLLRDDGSCVKFRQERQEEVAEEITGRVRLFSRDVVPLVGAHQKVSEEQMAEEVPDNWEDLEF